MAFELRPRGFESHTGFTAMDGMRRLMRGEDGRDTRLIEAVPEISTGPSISNVWVAQ